MKIFSKEFFDKQNLYNVIFKSDTREGKLFDIYLLIVILFSVLLVILDSIDVLHQHLKVLFLTLEYAITLMFVCEYGLRIYYCKKPMEYIISFYGIVDFITIFSSLLSIFLPVAQSLVIIRILRVLRIFRILNMKKFLSEATILINSLKQSFHKIIIFMLFVLVIAIILGAIMFLFESERNPAISSIPKGIYWAIVTLTTVGYGDITPHTDIGMFISGVVMILGYAIIAVPTGIVTANVAKNYLNKNVKNCPHCQNQIEANSFFCKYCGAEMKEHSKEANNNTQNL